MIAQYYPDEKRIAIFPDENSTQIMSIPSKEKKLYGFPPFREWRRVAWGYEIEFTFEVNQEVNNEM